MFVQPFAHLVKIGVVLNNIRALEVLGLARIACALPSLEDTWPVPVVRALHARIWR